MPGVTHIVQIQFKPSASASQVNNACSRMLALKNQCTHPDTGKPYIVSSKGGKECSIEGMQFRADESEKDGITHVFVVEFASVEDRDHYAKKDPHHLGFAASLEGIVGKVQVVDFVGNAFE